MDQAHARRLFIASCLALVTSAFSFQMRQDVNDQWGVDFQLTKEFAGTVLSAAFLGMSLAMLVFSPLAETLGLKRVMGLAWLCHATGILGTIFAAQLGAESFMHPVTGAISAAATTVIPKWFMNLPTGDMPGYWVLWFSTFLVGCGNGLLEVAINPLAATIYPDQKTHKLNVLHAWWPGGLMIAGLIAVFVINPIMNFKPGEPNDPAVATMTWRVKIGLLLIPLVAYGILCLIERFPQTERVQANVSTGQAWLQLLRPMFIIWAFCMLLTAATELGPQNWQESVLKRTTHGQVSGTLILVYTSTIMFVLRHFAGHIVERISPVVMLMGSAVLSAAGLYLLSFASGPVTAFAAATLFGVGIVYFWPTMLGVTSERFPKGGALLMGWMGSIGNLSIAFILPMIGGIYDSYTVSKLPAEVREMKFEANGKTLDVVEKPEEAGGGPGFIPQEVKTFFYPAGGQKLNPALNDEARKQLSPEVQESITAAEAAGAAYAFRRVAVLPCVLVVIFGLIAVYDRLRGGYKAEQLATPPKTPAGAVAPTRP